jgi:hypothetical protein
MNDNEGPPVTLILGRARRRKDGKPDTVHVMLIAADEDAAVRAALGALQGQGYVEAELDRIGEMEGMPDEEPHASAYQGAVEGEVSIIVVDDRAGA